MGMKALEAERLRRDSGGTFLINGAAFGVYLRGHENTKQAGPV